MEPLTPQLMHKLVFTVLMHGLNDQQTTLAYRVLVGAMENPNGQIRELAVVAMADLPVAPTKRVAALAFALRDESSRVRRRAARALGDQGPAAIVALSQLIDGLHDADASVRRDCAGTLGRLGPAAESGSQDLVSMLDESETRSRAIAAVALKRIGLKSLRALLEGVNAPSATLRGRCTSLVAQIAPGHPEVTATLERVLNDSDPEVRARADEAMHFVKTPMPSPFRDEKNQQADS